MIRMWGVFKRAWWPMVLGGVLLCSCNQDPIFYGISLEVEPVDPRIVGMPTHIVAIGGTFYVATRFGEAIYYYEGSAGWTELPQRPGGPILELAATETTLYALTGEPGSTGVYKWDGGQWEPLANAGRVQSIYGAGGHLFAGAMTGTDTFTMLYENENGGTLEPLSGGSGFLQGAAYNGTDYYLAGTGLYKLDLAEKRLSLVAGEGISLTGLIRLEDNSIVGVSNGGTLLCFSPSGPSSTTQEMGVHFTGALALWGEGGTKSLLLLGIQSSSSTSTTHGYREIVLSEGSLGTGDASLRTPGGESPSSVSNYEKYSSSLGKHPVMALFQASDGVLFAGTTKNGLWSYRNEQWNAEP